MHALDSMLGNTPEQQLVSRATDEVLLGTDWALILEVVDLVNSGEKETIREVGGVARFSHESPVFGILRYADVDSCLLTQAVDACKAWRMWQVMRGLRRRLFHKEPVVQMHSLNLLQALMENCHEPLHEQ
eukprot:5850742-Pleurochrysis_carterae.AAC.3